MKKGDILLAMTTALSLYLICQAVQEYNSMVAGLPRSGWEVQFYIDQWNAAILWLRHQIYLRMMPFVGTLVGLAIYRGWRGWKASHQPLLNYLVQTYVDYLNIWRRVEKWANTNISAEE